ncbi:hypothetical protein [Burkholderia sp. LA-2-3-30-S1-D2]|uniref:hypothetical protein n=1 Tax=Burkholderia sp. LA-2-3-30-S1-D2 TaxID=1637862 RepID=UPI00131F32E3|nr:hypothetical protein [Burkholderia sp. LA-2-3-30-S1-D2]
MNGPRGRVNRNPHPARYERVPASHDTLGATLVQRLCACESGDMSLNPGSAAIFLDRQPPFGDQRLRVRLAHRIRDVAEACALFLQPAREPVLARVQQRRDALQLRWAVERPRP